MNRNISPTMIFPYCSRYPDDICWNMEQLKRQAQRNHSVTEIRVAGMQKNNHRALSDLKSMTDGNDKHNIHIFKNAATEGGRCNDTAKYKHLERSLQG